MRFTGQYPFDKTEPDVYDHLRHRWHKLKRISRVDRILAITVLSFAILLLMFIDTATRWEDQAAQISANQSALMEQCDTMQDEIDELAAKVEKWEGIR